MFKVHVCFFWRRFGRLGLIATALARDVLRSKFESFWIGFGRSGLKLPPVAGEVLRLEFEASGEGLEG